MSDEDRACKNAHIEYVANLLALKFAIKNGLPEVYRLASANLRVAARECAAMF